MAEWYTKAHHTWFKDWVSDGVIERSEAEGSAECRESTDSFEGCVTGHTNV